MRVLGLDISSKTGWGVIDGDQLVEYGLVRIPARADDKFLPDVNAMRHAMELAANLFSLIKRFSPDRIYVEQTNGSRSRTTQKNLEFLHYALLQILWQQSMPDLAKVRYINTSDWRSRLRIRLDKEQKKHNKAVRQKVRRGKITPKHLAVTWANTTYNLKFKKQDHDIAEGIALAACGQQIEQEPPLPSVPVDTILAPFVGSKV